MGIAVGVIIYVSPSLFFAREKTPPRPLKTGGTSSVFIMLSNSWRTAYRHEKGIEVDFESSGSTEAIKRLIDQKFSIAFTHAPMSDEQRQAVEKSGGEVVQIPVIICATVVAYDVPELKGKPPLKLTGEALADIFLGKITRWNAPEIQKLNEGVTLPDRPIVVVHREDSSGTTFLFTDFLGKSSAAWRQAMGPPRSEVKWPVGVGMRRNSGVAEHIHRTEDTLGYVDLGQADRLDLDHAAIRNRDGTTFIHAEASNMTASADGAAANVPADLVIDLTNQPGKDAYPITGVIYGAFYRTPPAGEGKRVKDFLHWALHDGQKLAAYASYAPLPEPIVKRADERLASINADSLK
jgi:phosphate transport system substrate-binding protein